MRRLTPAVATSFIVSALMAQAAAQAVKPTPAAGHPTQVVTVAGTAFGNGEAVDVYIDFTDTVLVVSSATGTFTGTLTIPASAAPGVHFITAIGRRSGDAAQASFNVTTSWNQQGFGAAHLAVNPYENTINAANANDLGALWASSINTAGGTPAVSSGIAYIGAYPGVAAINTGTGATIWTSTIGQYFYGSPAISGGFVYIGTNSSVMYSLFAVNGKVHWATTLGGGTFSSPVLANGILYFGCGDNNVYALNASTGAVLWKYATGSIIDGSAAVVNGVVYIGSWDASIYALNAITGALIWSYKTGGLVEGTPAVANGVVYFISDDGKLYAVKAAGPNAGTLLWSFATSGGGNTSPAVSKGVVYVGASNVFYALNARTGALLWNVAIPGVVSSPAIANGVVYVTASDDTMYVLDAPTGTILGSSVTGTTARGNPVISDGAVYIASYQQPLYAFALRAGSNVARKLIYAPAPASLRPNLGLVAMK